MTKQTTEKSVTSIPQPQKSKTSGLGYVYSSSTAAVGETFRVVGSLAVAGRMLAQNAETQAAVTRIEGAKDLLESIGINDLSGVEGLIASRELVNYIKSID